MAARAKKVVRGEPAAAKTGSARAGRRAKAEVETVRRAQRAASPETTGARRAGRRPNRARVEAIRERLARAIPHPHVELTFEDPWQLLVAVILSAQSTDRRVNQVTPELFERWPNPAALAAAPLPEVEELIRSTGFFRSKAKAICGASQGIAERFGGVVPRSMAELLTLPGVARKTANVVLGAAHGVAEGIAVDTHAMRVTQRLQLTAQTAPEKIEAELCRLLPAEDWTVTGHRLVLHGRYVCTARSPKCPACPLNETCPSRQAKPEGDWQERARAQASDMEERALGFKHV